MSLEALFAPRSVAIVGASDNPDKIGGRPIRFLQAYGFPGAILPINPRRATVQGLPAWPGIADLPEAPDVAIVAVGADEVPETIEACAARGTRAAIVMSSGFGETGEAGRAEEERLKAVARASGMRIVGPNSQGFANFGTGAILSFSTMFIEAPPADGPVACVSQSGAMSVVPYGLLRARGIGVRHVHATGNDCDVTASEVAAACVEDPQVRLLLLYLERLDDPATLARAAARARERGVAIVALKAGRSKDGERAALSHTGAIATPDRVVDAFMEAHGIWRADGMRELVHASELYLKEGAPKGRRVAIVSNSGATCVMAADAAARTGLPLARLEEDTRARLRRILPPFAATDNPIDITAALLTNSRLFGEVLPATGNDPCVDCFFVGIPVSGEGYDYPAFAADTGAFMRTTGMPLVAAVPQPSVRAAFDAEGVPTFETEEEAFAALAQYIHHHERIGRAIAEPPEAPVVPPTDGGSRVLSEDEGLSMLERHGVAVARRRPCVTAAEAIGFLRTAREGIVLKASSARVPHKSEHGLVRVGLSTPDAVAAAFEAIETTMERLGLPFEGVLAAEMVRGQREIAVGGHVDRSFGPVIVVGDGGVLVEAMPDTAMILPPASEAAVRRALSRLRIAPLFEGIVAAVHAVRHLLESGVARAVDINPLLVSSSGAVAVDALVELREAAAEPAARAESAASRG